MKHKPIIIVLGEPFSVFPEILFKCIKKKILIKCKRPIIIIGSIDLIKRQMKFFKYRFKINEIENKNISSIKNNSKINIINVKLETKKIFEKNPDVSKKYIEKSFRIALEILKKKLAIGMINGPINKKKFLNKKFEGITEYLVKNTNTSKYAMLIYNRDLSVCPITTHIPLKNVISKIKVGPIVEKILLINKFYKSKLKINPKFAILGLNPHCETNHKISEEEKIIKPAINLIRRKKISIEGPLSADTFFIKNNYKNFNIVVGMYHDQVLTPIKTLFNFNAINLTIGLPFIRISPDHGPNEKMVSKGISDPLSLINSINFFERL